MIITGIQILLRGGVAERGRHNKHYHNQYGLIIRILIFVVIIRDGR